jgi:molybdate transport repressor ModE-like protein
MPEPLLDVGRLRLLREVGRRGTIAAAARALGLTASAVSQQLAVLEREAGAPLLDRSPRGVVLTGAGRALSEHTDAVLDLLARARADLEQRHGEIAGEVRLATVASAAATIVSDAVLALRADHPGIELRVQTAEPGHSLDLLIAGDVDLAVIDEYDHQPVARPDYLVMSALRTEPLVIVAPVGLLPGRGPIPLADLSLLDWVMPPDDAACGFAVRAACRGAGFEPRVRWETDDMLLLARAVASGHGVAVLPRLAVDESASQVDVRTLSTPTLVRRLSTVARSAGTARPVVQAVRAALTAAANR